MTPPPSPEQKPGDATADTPESTAPAQPASTTTPASTTSTTSSAGATPLDEAGPDATPAKDAVKNDAAPSTSASTTPSTSSSTVPERPAVDNADDDDADGDDSSSEVLASGTEDTSVKGGANDTLVPLAGTLVALLAVVVVLIIGFVLPATKSGPNHLPIGVAGPAAVTTQVKTLFSENDATAFEVKEYGDEAALRNAIDNRKIYGGLVVTETGGSMLIASAASSVVADTLNSIGTQLGAQVSDAKAAPEKDPRGAGLAAAGLPLALAGVLPALLLIRVYRRRPLAQLGTAIAASFVIGAAAALLLTTWLGATQGANVWLLAVAIAAAVLASNLILLGLNAVGGLIGLGVGLTVLTLSVALSGLSSAPEWLPSPWGDVGQFLPAGAGATLLRNAAFFDGNAAGLPLAVLGAWALVGLLLLILSESLTPALPEDEPLQDEDDEDKSPAAAI